MAENISHHVQSELIGQTRIKASMILSKIGLSLTLVGKSDRARTTGLGECLIPSPRSTEFLTRTFVFADQK